MAGRAPRRFPAAAAVHLVACLASPSSLAATPEAWAAHEREVAAACVAASALRGAKPAGPVIEFDDRVGKTALLLEGRDGAPHLQGRRAHELCLFDKRAREAALAPVEGPPPPRGDRN